MEAGILPWTPTGAGLALAGFLFLIAIFFKLGSAPLHNWSLDLYENLSYQNLIWIMIFPKILFIFTLNSTYNRLFSIDSVGFNLISLFAISSLIVGSLGLLQQTQAPKRFLTYSGISNLGIIL